ncbi:hypothetical protein BDV96DRAFT_490581 [Lophiotrema nucula]|uniref:Thioesterase domain-containing protein n=1 Tax=Lophiotrema nucula TaxID=690887 RepID=A0A6A5ZB92_9PLEO|nr:hypothetical protein BDV96DRAFT_490581 [Lophiotrema nucula]
MFASRTIPAALQLLKLSARPLSRCRTPQSRAARYSSTSAKQSRFRFSYVFYAICLAGGIAGGYSVRSFLRPLALLQPGSHEDELAMEALKRDVEALDLVKTMRSQGYHLHSDTPLNESVKGKAGWMELEIDRSMTEDERDPKLITRLLSQQTLAGAQGLGIQRAFWNSETRELVAVVWMGGSMSGWPGLAHGGAIATLFEDAMSRLVAGPNVSLGDVPGPLSVSVTYARPTQILNFYVLRASFSQPNLPQDAPPPEPQPAKSWLPFWKDLTKKSAPTAEPTSEVTATLESLDGTVCVRAKGTFPASSSSPSLAPMQLLRAKIEHERNRA